MHRFALLLFLTSSPVLGAPVGFGGPSSPVTQRQLSPHYRRYASTFWYSEQYYFGATSPTGEALHIHFQFSNIGLTKGKASVKLTYIDASGKRWRTITHYSSKQWHYRRDRFSVTVGPHRLSGRPGEIGLSIRSRSVSATIRFHNQLPPWRPGRGRLHLGDPNQFYDVTLLAPRAVVSGTVTLGPSATPIVFRGLGYADHSFGTIPPHQLVKRWVRLRDIGKRHTVIMSVLQVPRGQWRGFLYIAQGKRVVAHLGPLLNPLSVQPDNRHPNRYRVPLTLALRMAPGSAALKGRIRAIRLEQRSDTLKTLSRMERFFVAKFAKPMYYQFRAAYALAIRTAAGPLRLSGQGTYIYQQLN